MRFLIFIFILLQFFYLFENKKLYYLLQEFTSLAQERKSENIPRKRIFILKGFTLAFMIYMIVDFLYLLFCLWLIFSNNYWQQGGMLFIISSLETYAFHTRVDFTYDEAENGYIYPKAWCRCLFTGMSLYILSKLYFSI